MSTEYKFITELSDRFKCLICFEIVRDPKQHEGCGKIFCSECIEKCKNNPCPCGKEGTFENITGEHEKTTFTDHLPYKTVFSCTDVSNIYSLQRPPVILNQSLQGSISVKVPMLKIHFQIWNASLHNTQHYNYISDHRPVFQLHAAKLQLPPRL